MRPSWKVDLKWLFGLACVVSMVVAGVLYSASKLTGHGPATGMVTGVLTELAKESDTGEEEFAELQRRAAEFPDEEFAILEDVTLPVKGHELEGLTYDEAIALVAGRIAEELYTEGPDAVKKYLQSSIEEEAGEPSEDAASLEDAEQDLGPAGLFTQDTHDKLSRFFLFSLIAVALTAAPLVFFSQRFGRLGSPGVALILGTAPLALFWLIAKQIARDPGDDGLGAAVGQSLEPAAASLSTTFLILLALGIVMVVAAMAGHVGFAVRRRFGRPSTEAPGTEAVGPDTPSPGSSGGEEHPYVGPGGVSQA